MVYQVPASRASIRQNVFEFQVEEGGRVYSVPLLKFLPLGIAERLQAIDDPNIADILSLFGEGDAADVVRKLDGEQVGALMDAWREASGIDLPKS